jgi:Domain of unknown function (DUF1835)/Protein of unknown function
MIHIVFQEADVHVMNRSFELDESFKGPVILFRDDYAVGPVKNIFSEEGRNARKTWWKNVLENGPYEELIENGQVDDEKEISGLREKLDADQEETVWIWAAQNAHDVSGYYWLISQLKDYAGRVYTLYLNNLPFINEKGHIFYPLNLFEIQPKEFLKAKKLARPVTSSEFEIDPDEWSRLCAEDKGVRILEGGKKLQQYSYDYYDQTLRRYLSPDWQKVHKVLHSFISKNRPATGDAYLLWRINLMITGGLLDQQGDPKNWKEFEVKLKAAVMAEEVQQDF